MKCEICGKDFAHLGLHINYQHKDITQKEYYDRYLKQGGEGFCFTCGQSLPFVNLIRGYKHYCNAKCELADKRVVEKAKQTYKEKTGYDHNMHNPESKELVKNTTTEKYGGIGFAVKELADKVLDTYNKEHGTDIEKCNMIVHENPELEQQRIKTRIEKNNGSYMSDVHKRKLIQMSKEPEIIKKRINTRIKNNGSYWSVEMTEKSKQTSLEKYGYEYWSSNPENYEKTLKNRLNKNNGYLSKAEKKFAEMLKNRHVDFKYNYVLNKKHWDFAIFNNGILDILIEIDSEYNHGLMKDADGKHVRGEQDFKRFSKINDNIKFLVIDSKRIDEGIKETINLMGINYDNFIQKIIELCNTDFPYPSYDEKRMLEDYERLCRFDNIKATLTYSLITNFHKSIWHCHVKNKPSPYEAWYNKDLLKKCIENRFIYKSVLSSQNVLNGFNICKIAPKISLFNPNIAKYLIKKYLNNYQIVFDPFSGYSGRMLGCCSLNKKYIGQDVNEITINESLEIKNFLHLDSELSCKDIFESSGEYDCLFTCPPYGDKENWNQVIKNIPCDQWIDECLKRFKCKNYLFVVDNTEKYKNNVVEEICNKSHFGLNTEKIILI